MRNRFSLSEGGNTRGTPARIVGTSQRSVRRWPWHWGRGRQVLLGHRQGPGASSHLTGMGLGVAEDRAKAGGEGEAAMANGAPLRSRTPAGKAASVAAAPVPGVRTA